MANAAGLDLDAHLPATGLRNGTLDYFEISSGLADLDSFHRGTFPVLAENICGIADGLLIAWQSASAKAIDQNQGCGDARISKTIHNPSLGDFLDGLLDPPEGSLFTQYLKRLK